jgi:uncharacterized membrane protein
VWYKVRVTLFLASLYNWLVLAHVLAAMVWLGALVILAAFSVRILRVGEAEEAGRFVGSLRVIGPLALAPAPLTLLAAGLAMVGDSDAWDFGQGWVQLGIGLFAAVGVGHGAHRGLDRGRHVGHGVQARAHLIAEAFVAETLATGAVVASHIRYRVRR